MIRLPVRAVYALRGSSFTRLPFQLPPAAGALLAHAQTYTHNTYTYTYSHTHTPARFNEIEAYTRL